VGLDTVSLRLLGHLFGIVNLAAVAYLAITLGRRNRQLDEQARVLREIADLLTSRPPDQGPRRFSAVRKAPAIDIRTRVRIDG
jgi:hypothetical protein